MEDKDLKQLEELEVIESSELAIGHPFHAFKFSTFVSSEQPASQDSQEAK